MKKILALVVLVLATVLMIVQTDDVASPDNVGTSESAVKVEDTQTVTDEQDVTVLDKVDRKQSPEGNVKKKQTYEQFKNERKFKAYREKLSSLPEYQALTDEEKSEYRRQEALSNKKLESLIDEYELKRNEDSGQQDVENQFRSELDEYKEVALKLAKDKMKNKANANASDLTP